MIDYETRLAQVQAAIAALLSGGVASYTIEGMSVTKLDLAALTREEARLIALIARRRRGGAFRRVAPR